MKTVGHLSVAMLLTLAATLSSNAMAACILTDVEVEVIIPTDFGIQELEVEVTDSRSRTANATFYLKKGESDVFRPALQGDHFDIVIEEVDRYKNDKFPRVRAGCTSGSKTIKYGAAKLNVLWTVI